MRPRSDLGADLGCLGGLACLIRSLGAADDLEARLHWPARAWREALDDICNVCF